MVNCKIFFISLLLLLSGCSEADWNAITESLNTVAQNLEQQKVDYLKVKEIQKTQKTQKPQTIPPASFVKTVQRISRAIEPTNPIVRNFAVNLAKKYPGAYTIPQICSIWYDLKENWRYVSDPRGKEYFAPANETIKIGLAGDCDDFAILMTSLIEAIGGTSRIIFTLNVKQSNHAYCEVLIGNNEQEKQIALTNIASYFKRRLLLHWTKDQDSRCWLNLDWSADYPGGPFFETPHRLVIYPNGNWEIGAVR